MVQRLFERVKPGDPITAESYNKVLDALEYALNNTQQRNFTITGARFFQQETFQYPIPCRVSKVPTINDLVGGGSDPAGGQQILVKPINALWDGISNPGSQARNWIVNNVELETDDVTQTHIVYASHHINLRVGDIVMVQPIGQFWWVTTVLYTCGGPQVYAKLLQDIPQHQSAPLDGTTGFAHVYEPDPDDPNSSAQVPQTLRLTSPARNEFVINRLNVDLDVDTPVLIEWINCEWLITGYWCTTTTTGSGTGTGS